MSHLAEVYSLGSGAPLDKPTIPDAFYPLSHPIDKSILIHAFAGGIKQEGNQLHATFSSKIYDHFNEVIELLRPVVESLGYKIFQIGSPGEPSLKNIESLVGKTTLHQCAFLVKNAALLIGNDSMWAHVAGAYNRPIIAIYGPTSKPHMPFWNNPNKSSFIESHRQGKKPSYASQEAPKTINWIPPEKIVNDAMSILEASPHSNRKSIYIGELYNQHIVELVPDVIVDPRLQMPGPPIIRMDLVHNEEILASNLQLRKCSIVLNKEINLNLLAQFKPNIESMRFEVDNLSSVWLKQVKKLGISTGFFANERDSEKLANLRFSFYDTCLFDKYQPLNVEDFLKGVSVYCNKDLDKDFKWEILRFKTNKFILSDNKIFLSRAHWKAGKSAATSDANTEFVINTPEFWEEQSHFYFYTE